MSAVNLAKPAKKFPSVAQLKSFNLKSSNGLTFASVEDAQSPISSLALVLNTGTRFQSVEQAGAAHWLKFNAFRSTHKSSSIKITRESEILGHSLSASLTRENLYLNVNFNRSDLPAVVELFGEIVQGFTSRDQAQWGPYSREFVRRSADWKQSVDQAIADSRPGSAAASVIDNLFSVAFRSGLANPLYPSVSSVSFENALEFAQDNITAGRVKLIGYGVDFDDLANSTSHYFPSLTEGSEKVQPSKYYGGEAHSLAESPIVGYALAFSGASLSHADYFTALVVKHLLGSNTSAAVKYGDIHSLTGKIPSSTSVETFSFSFSDAGLFGFYLESDSSANVNAAATQVVSALKSLTGSVKNLGAAVASAKADLASQVETASREEKIVAYSNQVLCNKLFPTEELLKSADAVDEQKVQSFVKKLLKSKPSVSSIGDSANVFRVDQLNI